MQESAVAGLVRAGRLRHVSPFVLFQINRAINSCGKHPSLTTETLSRGDFKRFSLCLCVSVVQNGLKGLLGLIVNLQQGRQCQGPRLRGGCDGLHTDHDRVQQKQAQEFCSWIR
jgi:hypothetical protein